MFGSGNTGFKFGNTSTTATSGGTTGFSFGAPKTSATTTTGFNLTSGVAPTSVTSSNTSTVGPLLNQKLTPAVKGLGGVDVVKTGTSSSCTNDKTDVISPAVQDLSVPDEICKDVKVFEDYVAKQKAESNEVGKFSIRSLHKISEEVHNLSVSIATISSSAQRNKAFVEKLREDFGKQLKHAEMAQRTQNTPHTLQHDNVAPIYYFIDLANNFDESMKLYRQQIDELENHIQSSQANLLTPQDISLALVKMQETFVTLASNLHSLHDNVKLIKDQYLAYRRIVHNDNADVFATQKENKLKSSTTDRDKSSCRCQLGMPPFQNLSNVAALAVASMMQPQQQTQALVPPQQNLLQSAFGAPGSINPFAPKTTASGLFNKSSLTSSTSLFPSSGFGAANNPKAPALSAGVATTSSGNIFFGNTSFNSSAGVTFGGAATANKNSFDLKPPPIGSKRNKKLL